MDDNLSNLYYIFDQQLVDLSGTNTTLGAHKYNPQKVVIVINLIELYQFL